MKSLTIETNDTVANLLGTEENQMDRISTSQKNYFLLGAGAID